jgi:hypothetical protein
MLGPFCSSHRQLHPTTFGCRVVSVNECELESNTVLKAEIEKCCCIAIREEVNTDDFHIIEHCMRCHFHTYIIAEVDVS